MLSSKTLTEEVIEIECKTKWDGPKPCPSYVGLGAFCDRCGVAWERH